MARDMYLVGVSEDELKPDPKPEGPKTPKGKWDNYWYHYKWHTLGAFAVVVVLAVLIVQMVTKNEPDYTLNIVTEKPLAQPVLNWLKAELEVYGQDLDGDGYVEVRIDNLYMSDSTQSGMAMANAQKLTVHMGAGDALFFAFEPKYYEQYVKNNEKDGFRFFTKLDVADDNLLEDGRVWHWKNGKRTEVVKQFEDLGWDDLDSVIPPDLYFGVRDAIGTASKNGDVRDDSLALLKAFITDRPLGDGNAATQAE